MQALVDSWCSISISLVWTFWFLLEQIFIVLTIKTRIVRLLYKQFFSLLLWYYLYYFKMLKKNHPQSFTTIKS